MINIVPDLAIQTDGLNKFGGPAQNPNPYGFIAPMGPASQALVPYYNKVTGESWTAPSGGYTPPSADWIQGYPGSSQITPMPTFAPGSDLVRPAETPGNIMPLPGFAPGMDPVQPDSTAYSTSITGGNLLTAIPSPVVGNVTTQMPVTNAPVMTPTQQAPNQNTGGLNSLLATPKSPVNSVAATGGLNALTVPQIPRPTGLFGSTQPFTRNRPMPIAGSLPSLRVRPTFRRSLPVSFAKPPFRR